MNLVPFTCPDCGRKLMLNAHQMQTKRCPDCAYKAKMEKTYASRRRKRAEAREAKEKPQKQVSNMQAISELAAAARREGLTYGQYAAGQDSIKKAPVNGAHDSEVTVWESIRQSQNTTWKSIACLKTRSKTSSPGWKK